MTGMGGCSGATQKRLKCCAMTLLVGSGGTVWSLPSLLFLVGLQDLAARLEQGGSLKYYSDLGTFAPQPRG